MLCRCVLVRLDFMLHDKPNTHGTFEQAGVFWAKGQGIQLSPDDVSQKCVDSVISLGDRKLCLQVPASAESADPADPCFSTSW